MWLGGCTVDDEAAAMAGQEWEKAREVSIKKSLTARLTRFYRHHNTEQLSMVGSLVEQFWDKQDEMNDVLRLKYRAALNDDVFDQLTTPSSVEDVQSNKPEWQDGATPIDNATTTRDSIILDVYQKMLEAAGSFHVMVIDGA